MALRRLSALGLRVCGVDRGEAPELPADDRWDPRVYALSPASISALQAAGCWSAIDGERRSPYQRMTVWSGDPDHALHFDAGDVARPALGAIVEHARLLAALHADLGEVTIHHGDGIESLTHTADGLRVELISGRRIDSRLVIAADGGGSRTRELAGIRTTGWQYPQSALVCYLQPERPHEATAWQRFGDDGTLALLPIADGRCSIVWSVPCERADALLALDDDDFAYACTQAFQHRLGALHSPARRFRFELSALQAESFSRDGVVLLGDAAHVVHPLAGQGVNLGFGDVEELVRQLAAAGECGQRIDHPRMLARYARARQARSAEMLAVTDGLYRVFGAAGDLVSRPLSRSWQWLERVPLARQALIRQAVSAG